MKIQVVHRSRDCEPRILAAANLAPALFRWAIECWAAATFDSFEIVNRNTVGDLKAVCNVTRDTIVLEEV